MKTRAEHLELDTIDQTVLTAPSHTLRGALPLLTVSLEAVRHAIRGAQRYLLDRQEPEGYWVAELEGDTILESEYLLLLQFLGRRDPEKFRKVANYIRSKQHPEGYWSIYPGGPPDVSASVKAYFACKLAGYKES